MAVAASGQDARSGAITSVNDYELGLQLRRQILSDRERGVSSDGRRLQALMGDFCADRQAALLPALRYLVMSAGFSNALNQQPPLPADPQQHLRLQQELQQVFAAAICERMDAVLRGLLNLPATGMAMASAASDLAPERLATAALATEERADESLSIAAPAANGNGGLVALLGFIAGVLVVGVGGGLAWLWLQNGQLGVPESGKSQRPLLEQPLQPENDPVTQTPPPVPDLSGEDLSRAITSVQQVYNNLSLGNSAAARQLFSGQAADQFDPAFFQQFQRVSVDDLRETGRDGSVIKLQGVVTFVYPDGTSQSEARDFSVDSASDPPLITASSFVQVLRGRH
jgi:hypothetical protein